MYKIPFRKWKEKTEKNASSVRTKLDNHMECSRVTKVFIVECVIKWCDIGLYSRMCDKVV